MTQSRVITAKSASASGGATAVKRKSFTTTAYGASTRMGDDPFFYYLYVNYIVRAIYFTIN